MKANTFTLDVDIKQDNYINEPVIKQNDSVVFIINLTDDGAPMDLTGVVNYSIATTRGDGAGVIGVGKKTGDSQVTFNLLREATMRTGRASHTVQLYSADERVSSFTFPMIVEKDPSASLIVTGGDKTIIEIVLGEGPKVIQDAKDATKTASNAAAESETQGTYAKTQGDYAKAEGAKANVFASAADVAADKATESATNANASKERADISADTADASADKANASAENADESADRANAGASRADIAATDLKKVKAETVAATDSAITAAEFANAEASDLDDLKSAVTAATATANDTSTRATTQGDYAKEQGDYAKTQGDHAKLQGDHAKTEGDKAALETDELASMKVDVEIATTSATDAALLANTEASGLAELKDTVTAATVEAESSSTVATDQAAYAKLQGDYAKRQGDAVQDVFDQGLVASVNGKMGAVVLDADDVGAETPEGSWVKADAAELSAKDYADAKISTSEQSAKDYTDAQIAAIPDVDLSSYSTKTELQTEKDARVAHENKQIHEGAIHGMRLTDGTFEVFDGTEWIEIKGGGGSNIPLGNVENLSATAEVGLKIKIAWKDPADVVIDGVTFAKWGGTMLRRKEGTYPVDEKDGVLIVDSKTRDAYTSGYTDTGLSDGVTYYYALFPYTENGVTVDSANRASAKAFEKYTQSAPTKPTASKLQQNKATVTSSAGSVVSLSQVDWFASPHEFTGLTDGSRYTPYAKFKETADKWESPIATGDVFTAVNKLPKPAPAAPTTSGLKHDRVTINTDSGAVVSINQSDWFAAPHEFTGLTAEKTYSAYAKFAETSTHLESPVSSKEFTTPSAVKIYGIKIDTNNSNPETAVTYTDDAVGTVPMRLRDGKIDMGGWAGRYPYNEITPVVVKDGVEQYELNPNDYTQKKAGGAADITSGNAGDVFSRFSPAWWKIEMSGTDLYVRMATAPTPGYKKLAHMRGGQDLEFAYIGAYLGYNEGGKLRSLSGKTVTASQTIGTFRTQAQAQGAGYTQFDYYKLLMVQVMLLIATKNRDSQAALGRGYVDSPPGYATTGGTDKKGLNFGETTGKLQNKIFGIEDFWGNYFQWIDGLVTDGAHNILIGDNVYNDTGSGYTNYGKGAAANFGGYITQVQGGTETGFIVKEAAGSETTHWADAGHLTSGSLPYFGGNRADAVVAGAFRLSVSRSASYASASYAARACFAK